MISVPNLVFEIPVKGCNFGTRVWRFCSIVGIRYMGFEYFVQELQLEFPLWKKKFLEEGFSPAGRLAKMFDIKLCFLKKKKNQGFFGTRMKTTVPKTLVFIQKVQKISQNISPAYRPAKTLVPKTLVFFQKVQKISQNFSPAYRPAKTLVRKNPCP